MKKPFHLLLAVPLFFSASNFAMAEATEEEATRLQNLFQTYLGNEPGVVTVEADGDDYTATFDLAPLTKKYATKGETMSMSPLEITLSDKGDGQWDVSHSGKFNFEVSSPDTLSLKLSMDEYESEGVFDENLITFTEASSTSKNIKLFEEITDQTKTKTVVDISIANLTTEQTGQANANGGIDLSAKYKFDGLTEAISGGPTNDAGAAAFNTTITAADGNYDLSGKGLKSKSIFNLISFMISHQDKDALIKDQATLKTLLGSGIPLFENVNSTGVINKVSIVTPIGPVGLDSIAISADMNGVVKDGKFGESIALAGLSIPEAIVPPWATKLVPKNVTFDFNVSGFDLAAPATKFLETFDLSKPEATVGIEQMLMSLLLPKGTVDITLNPTSVSNDIYSLSAQGVLVAGPVTPIPSGKGTVKAKGLDEVMKILQDAPPEAGMQQGVAGIVAAKGLGKAEADSSFTWEVESSGDGKVLVNGIDVSKMK